jgi:tetratricopeptide (TPR) repeat protein
VLTHYSYFCSSLPKLDRAKQLLEEALALSSTLDDEAHAADIGLMLYFLVRVLRLQEQAAKARVILQKSMQTCHSVDFQMGMVMCTAMRGEIEEDSGNYDTARHYYERALSLAENAQFIVGTLYALVLLGNVHSALADYRASADYLRRGLILNRDLLLIAPIYAGLIGIAALFGRQGQHALAVELLAIILNHPQCNIIDQHKARALLSELRSYVSDDEMKAATEKAKRGQLSNPYVEPNFTVDAELVDRLLALIDQAI